jgi:hypothetical protein
MTGEAIRPPALITTRRGAPGGGPARPLPIGSTMQGDGSPMSATSPPTPDDERWAAGPASRNGAAPTARSAGVHRLVVLGYITAVSMPPIGLVVGILVAMRPTRMSSKHGALIIVVSIIASLGWILILTSSALNTASTDY